MSSLFWVEGRRRGLGWFFWEFVLEGFELCGKTLFLRNFSFNLFLDLIDFFLTFFNFYSVILDWLLYSALIFFLLNLFIWWIALNAIKLLLPDFKSFEFLILNTNVLSKLLTQWHLASLLDFFAVFFQFLLE